MLYFGNFCFNSALLWISCFLSTQKPGFLLLVMVRLRVLYSTCLQYPENCLFFIMLKKHNRSLVLHSKECDQSSSRWTYAPFSSQLSPLLLTCHLPELRVDTGNSNAAAGLVGPAADDQLGDYISWALFHVLVYILNILSDLKRWQRTVTKRNI